MIPNRVVVIGVLGLFLLGGCQQVKELPADEAEAFADEVEPTVENLLVGLSDKDYEMHTRDFDEAMLDAVDPVTFPNMYDETIGIIGKYQSHSLSGVQQQNQYLIARYLAVFDNDSEVTVRVVFNKDDPERKVTGLWFDSELLRKK